MSIMTPSPEDRIAVIESCIRHVSARSGELPYELQALHALRAAVSLPDPQAKALALQEASVWTGLHRARVEQDRILYPERPREQR